MENMTSLGYKHTPEAIEKIRQSSLGRKLTDEQKRKIGEANKISLKGKHCSPKTEFKKGHVSIHKGKKGRVGYWKGRTRSYEDRKKMSINRIGLTAKEKHPKWKGGITSEMRLLRNSFEYKEWRRSVFKRDGWSCTKCGYRSHKKVDGRSDIEADHIKPFSLFPKLRFDVNNGRTVCRPCHKNITFNHV